MGQREGVGYRPVHGGSMARWFAFASLIMVACQPAPPASSRRVVELYMHPNGLSRCVELDGDRWKADPSCCPEGFEMVGFSVPAAIEYLKGEKMDKVKRTLYRHVVCAER